MVSHHMMQLITLENQMVSSKRVMTIDQPDVSIPCSVSSNENSEIWQAHPPRLVEPRFSKFKLFSPLFLRKQAGTSITLA